MNKANCGQYYWNIDLFLLIAISLVIISFTNGCATYTTWKKAVVRRQEIMDCPFDSVYVKKTDRSLNEKSIMVLEYKSYGAFGDNFSEKLAFWKFSLNNIHWLIGSKRYYYELPFGAMLYHPAEIICNDKNSSFIDSMSVERKLLSEDDIKKSKIKNLNKGDLTNDWRAKDYVMDMQNQQIYGMGKSVVIRITYKSIEGSKSGAIILPYDLKRDSFEYGMGYLNAIIKTPIALIVDIGLTPILFLEYNYILAHQ